MRQAGAWGHALLWGVVGGAGIREGETLPHPPDEHSSISLARCCCSQASHQAQDATPDVFSSTASLVSLPHPQAAVVGDLVPSPSLRGLCVWRPACPIPPQPGKKRRLPAAATRTTQGLSLAHTLRDRALATHSRQPPPPHRRLSLHDQPTNLLPAVRRLTRRFCRSLWPLSLRERVALRCTHKGAARGPQQARPRPRPRSFVAPAAPPPNRKRPRASTLLSPLPAGPPWGGPGAEGGCLRRQPDQQAGLAALQPPVARANGPPAGRTGTTARGPAHNRSGGGPPGVLVAGGRMDRPAAGIRPVQPRTAAPGLQCHW